MKLFSLSFLLSSSLAAFAAAAVAADDTITAPSAVLVVEPPRISFDALERGDDSSLKVLLDALTTTGLISVTNVPDLHSDNVFSNLHACALVSKASQKQRFADGAQRLTLATHSIPGPGGRQAIQHNTNMEPACMEFDQVSDEFRNQVASATQLFADRLTQALPNIEVPLLQTAQQQYSFDSLVDIVHAGEHLEHFRSYQKYTTTTNATKSTNDNDAHQQEDTIQLHTDQGLFLVFTPAQLIEIGSTLTATTTTTTPSFTQDFFMERIDGNLVRVDFTYQDSLVIMLGDGVNQIVNPNLALKDQLRAVPHSIHLKSHSTHMARVWYGRMVLPPSSAMHPRHQQTFGDLRKQMIQATTTTVTPNNAATFSLGCSGTRLARELSGEENEEEEEDGIEESSSISCTNETAIYCWHQCMELSEYNVTSEQCIDQELELTCMNPRLQRSTGEFHGDYYPGCLPADAEMETPIPTLPEYPRSTSVCTDDGFADFATRNQTYDYTSVLQEEVAMLLFSVKNDTVHARIAFNGLFGWLGFGLANPTGDKNGMHGAKVILALPGGNYSGFSGLDLSMNRSVATYQIDLEMTPFRYWMPSEMDGDLTSYEVESTDCYTALSFQASSIHGQPFNLTGSDELLWAANGEDYYVMYHGTNRGRFAIDWASGLVTVPESSQGATDDDTLFVSASSSLLKFTNVVVAAWTALLTSYVCWI